jgi:hypothetical protein
VLPHDHTSLSPSQIRSAVEAANGLRLPCAAVACVDASSSGASYLGLEQQLAEAGVPLMLVVGAPEAMLSALVHHLSPVFMVFSDTDGSDGRLLAPYARMILAGAPASVDGLKPRTLCAWPGTVIRVADMVRHGLISP